MKPARPITPYATVAPLSALACLAAPLAACPPTEPEPPPLPDATPILPSEVDVFMGTGGNGFATGSAFPGPALPYGMIRPGPDTQGESVTLGAIHCSGYRWSDPYIAGFSHVRLHGIGIPDMGAILLTPSIGWDESKRREAGYRLPKIAMAEIGSPGRYQVDLQDAEHGNVHVALTAGQRAAMHRYVFPDNAGADMGVLLDLAHALPDVAFLGGTLLVSDDLREISGSTQLSGPYSGNHGGEEIFFVLRFSRAPAEVLRWDESDEAGTLGAFARFDAAEGRMILVEIAISFISVENARANLQAELPDLDAFDWEGMADAAEASWTAELARFEIGGALADDRRVFASNAYHFLLMPTLFTDSDGRWLGFDGEVHDDPGFTYYSDYSLWDTYRTFHPLLNLVWPEKQADFVRSMLEMAEQQGFLPIWAMLSGETHGMLGDPAAVVISDALLHDGADYGIDPARARDAMLASIPRRERWAEYEQSGYYTVDGGGGSVALTLEHAWADAALGSALALLDGDDGAEAVAARERSLRWRNHWDEESRFLRARWADGSWHEPFDPLAFEEEGYVEGNAWHYRWMLPWDDAELVTRFGSPDDFASELETFFLNASTEEPSPWPSQWYWHGNEPDIHAAFLFTSAGRPDKSGRWQRWVEDARYGLGEAGLAGNDDAGTLAAWYLFSAAGLFPLAGTERYLLGAPRWPLLRMRSGSGWLSVVGDGWSEDARTADAVAVDGEDLPDFELRWEQIRDGGELRFTMAAD